MAKIHDVTLTLSADLPIWPNHEAPEIRPLRSMDAGGRNNMSHLSLNVHCGTHVDAPKHFVADGYGMDRIPTEVLIGPCVLAHFPEADEITPDMLDGLGLAPGTERLLLRTRNSEFWSDFGQGFRPDYVALTPEAGRWVVERGIRLVGIDYLSVERFREPGNDTHRTLLGAEVVLVEGLDLRRVAQGPYELICLPLKLKDCDGAPARVVLRET